MFTLGSRGLVPGHRAQNTNACTQGTGAYFSFRIQGLHHVLGYGHGRILAWILDKKGAFTLVASENRTRAPFSRTKCEHSLSLLHCYWEL